MKTAASLSAAMFAVAVVAVPIFARGAAPTAPATGTFTIVITQPGTSPVNSPAPSRLLFPNSPNPILIGEIVQPLPGQLTDLLPRHLVPPLPGQLIRPLPGQIIQPLPGQIVQPLAGQIVPPLRGQVIR